MLREKIRLPFAGLLALLLLVLPFQVAAVGTNSRGLERIDPAVRAQFEGEKKVAVVGVGAYPEISGLRPLDYAAADARALSKVLTAQGYLVKTLLNGNATRAGIRKTLRGAAKRVAARGEGTLVFAFSGHGFARGGENYLATFEATDTEIADTGLALSAVKSLLKESGARRQVMFIDACRNNPTAGKASPGGGVFERFSAAKGLAILFSTAFGELSHEASALGHGVFTHFLLQGLQGVGDWTYRHLTAVQQPYVGGEYYRDFLLAETQPRRRDAPPPVVPQTLPLTVQTTPEGARVRILDIKAKYEDGIRLKPGRYHIEVTHPGYEKHLSWFNVTKENSVYAVELKTVPKPQPPVSQAKTPQTVRLERMLVRLGWESRVTAGLVPQNSAYAGEMVSIKGDGFRMGSSASFISAFFTRPRRNERQQRVCVEDFAIGKYEVTNREYRRFRPNHNSGRNYHGYSLNSDDQPVVEVSWNDAVAYASWLSHQTGKRYRLPTEAEWEYACRGSRRGERYCGGDEIEVLAWYRDNSGDKTHPVGGKRENGFGLYDMSGNVAEMTCSAYDEDYKGGEQTCMDPGDSDDVAFRGGSAWNILSNHPGWAESDSRRWVGPYSRSGDVGFRLAQE